MTVTATANAASKPLRWIVNGPALRTFVSDPAAVRFFSNARPFVIEGKRVAGVSVPQSWNAVPVQVFPSYAKLERAFANGEVKPQTRAILYDCEVWPFTPDDEQRNFAAYNRKAAELVHAHGLQFISTPAVNLTRKVSTAPSERRYDTFLGANIIGQAARYADVVDIQAQGSEMGVDRYKWFVERAAAQARAANPRVTVLAGISTNPGGQHVDSGIILKAIAATRGAVDGYWFNVPQPSRYCPKCNEFRPDMAVEVLKRLGGF